MAVLYKTPGYHSLQCRGYRLPSFLYHGLVVGLLLLALQIVAGNEWAPKLIDKPDPKKLRDIYENNVLNLFCSFNASPTAVVAWSKDGGVLQLNARVKRETIIQRNKTVTLDLIEIATIRQSDAGVYTCVAKNTLGTARSMMTVSLRAAYAPIFKSTFPEVVLHAGEKYEQLCLADAYPGATYAWGKIGGLIDGRETKYFPDGRLVFSSATINRDNGVYRCTATNSVGDVTSDLSVKVVTDPYWVDVWPNVIIADAAHTLWINVTFTSTRDGVQVQWYKDSSEEVQAMLTRPRELDLDHFHSQLKIVNPDGRNSGNYTIRVTNSVGFAQKTIPVIVKGPPIVVINSVLTKYVDETHGSMLDCSAWGSPLPNITWYFGTVPVAVSHRHVNVEAPVVVAHNQVFLRYTAFEAGSFTCQASNKDGDASVVIELHPWKELSVPHKAGSSSLRKSYILIILVSCAVLVLVICIVLCLVWRKKRNMASSQRHRQTSNGFSDLVLPVDDDDDLSDYLVPLVPVGGYQSSSAVSPEGSNRSSQRISVDQQQRLSSIPKHMHLDNPNTGLHADATAVVLDAISIGEELGRGNFTLISLGHFLKEDEEEEREVAIKWLKEDSRLEDREMMLLELSTMRSLSHHPNIVNLLGWCITDDNVFILQDYAPHGNLLHLLRSYRGPLKLGSSDLDNEHGTLAQSDLLSFAWQVASGMKHLVATKVVHRDLAARNILIGHQRVCKISEIGSAKPMDNRHSHSKLTGGQLPLRWMAYESIFQGKYSHESDVWAFGVLLWEVVTLGEYPYPGIPDNDVLLKRLQTSFRMKRPSHCSDELFDLMGSCWSQEPSHRATFKEVCATIGNMMNEKTEAHIKLSRFAHSFKHDIGYVSEDDLPTSITPPQEDEVTV